MIMKRIVNYDKHDWKHIFFCIKMIIKGLAIGDIGMAYEGWLFFTMHLMYDSKRVK